MNYTDEVKEILEQLYGIRASVSLCSKYKDLMVSNFKNTCYKINDNFEQFPYILRNRSDGGYGWQVLFGINTDLWRADLWRAPFITFKDTAGDYCFYNASDGSFKFDEFYKSESSKLKEKYNLIKESLQKSYDQITNMKKPSFLWWLVFKGYKIKEYKYKKELIEKYSIKLGDFFDSSLQIVKETDMQSENLIDECKKIIQLAKDKFQCIDFRDWSNVDTLIYFFETGRAESVKEALQLVDKQKQTNEIVSSIKSAADFISYNIIAGSSLISNSVLLISNQFTDISKNLKHLVNNQEVQNALIEKANTSLSSLLSDVHYMMIYNN